MNVVTQPVTAAIILYGRSPLLDAVEITLRKNGRFPITRISLPHAPLQLNNVPTGTIIYDQNHTDPTAVFQLLSNYPGWQLVGLTSTSEELLIINSQKKNASTELCRSGRFPAVLSNSIQG